MAEHGNRSRMRWPNARKPGRLATQAAWWLWLVLAAGCSWWPLRPDPAPDALILSRRLTMQAQAAQAQGDWERASRLLQTAVEQCSYDPEARTQWAEVLWAQKRRQEAIEQLERAIQLVGPDAALLARRGEFHLALGHLEAAWRDAHAALQLDAQLASAWKLRARIYYHLGRYQDALADYCQVLHLQPDDETTLHELAQVHWQLAQTRSGPKRQEHLYHCLLALERWEDRFQEKPPPLELLAWKGRTYYELGRPQDALLAWQQARQRGWSDPEGLYWMALAYWQTGQGERARQELAHLLSLAPHHQAARRLWLHLQQSPAVASLPAGAGKVPYSSNQ